MKVFIADLSEIINIQDFLTKNFDNLSLPEQKRYNRILQPLKQTQFLVGRMLIKEYLKQGIEILPTGKPIAKNDKDTYISLSHSGQYIVFAISKNPIGIDIENTSVNRNFKGISEFLKFPTPTDKIDFYKNFTKFEAEYKLGKEYENKNKINEFYKLEDYILCISSVNSNSINEKLECYLTIPTLFIKKFDLTKLS